MKSKTRRDIWDLIRIEDVIGNTQFAVRLNGPERAVEVHMMDYKNDIQVAKFDAQDVGKVCSGL